MHDVLLKWPRVVVTVWWHLASRRLALVTCSGLLQPVVVSFNLINAYSAAGTCYDHTTKPGLCLHQSVAEVQWGVFGDESGC